MPTNIKRRRIYGKSTVVASILSNLTNTFRHRKNFPKTKEKIILVYKLYGLKAALNMVVDWYVYNTMLGEIKFFISVCLQPVRLRSFQNESKEVVHIGLFVMKLDSQYYQLFCALREHENCIFFWNFSSIAQECLRPADRWHG